MSNKTWKKIKRILACILIGIEVFTGLLFFVLYVLSEPDNHFRNLYYWLTIVFLFAAVITIYINDFGDKVLKGIKNVAKVIYNLTFGIVVRVFDGIFNMTTGSGENRLKKISGYEDTVYLVNRKKRKRKAEYKPYKDMDNREKVQFLYYKTVTKAIKKGFHFKGSDTAFEVNERMSDRKYLKQKSFEFGEIYSLGKYNSDGNITDDMVEKMKKMN